MKREVIKDTDKRNFRAAYEQAISDLETDRVDLQQVQGLTDQQIDNNIHDIIRRLAEKLERTDTILKKTLKVLKRKI